MNIDSTIKDSAFAENKIIVIDTKEVFFYDKVEISSGHSIYAAPSSKHNNDSRNIDEVIFLPKTFNDIHTGIIFIFSNNQNIQSISNDDCVGHAISNVIYSIYEFDYINISNSIIIRKVSDPLFPEEEVKIKDEIQNMRWLIEDYVDNVLSTYCSSVERPYKP